MAKQLLVLSDLAHRFSQFHDIADVTAELRSLIQQINDANETAGGTDDDVAKEYLKQIKQPTADLDKLVGAVEKILDTTGTKGGKVATIFSDADAHANTSAGNWTA